MSTGGRTSFSIPAPPSSAGMRDVFILPRGLGLWGVFERLKNFTFLNPLIYLYYYILTPPSTL